MPYTTTVRLADQITGHTATVESTDVADVLHSWHPAAPKNVTAAIDKLEAAIRADDTTTVINLSAYLALDVEIHRVKDPA